MERRNFLRGAVIGTSAAAFGGTLMRGAAYAAPAQPGPGPYGALGAADANGIQLPSGFTSRVIARSGQTVARHLVHLAQRPRRRRLLRRRHRLDLCLQLGDQPVAAARAP